MFFRLRLCVVSDCFVLYRMMLFSFLFCIVSYAVTMHFIVLYGFVYYRIVFGVCRVLFYVVLYCILWYHAVLFCLVVFHVASYCNIVFYFNLLKDCFLLFPIVALYCIGSHCNFFIELYLIVSIVFSCILL